MTTELQEAMTAGVYVEFVNGSGLVQGQAVFAPWRPPLLAQVGDTLVCAVISPASGRRIKLKGQVCRRQFEIQQDDNGKPCVWARLELRVLDTLPRSKAARSKTSQPPTPPEAFPHDEITARPFSNN